VVWGGIFGRLSVVTLPSRADGEASAPRALGECGGPVQTMATSADGRWVAAGCASAVVLLARTDGSGPPRRLLGHRAMVNAVAFSQDGRRLASVSNDGQLRVWPLGSEVEPRPGPDAARVDAELRITHPDVLHLVAFSPAGGWLATAGGDGPVRLRRLGSGEERVLRGHRGPVTSLTFSPDGRFLATAGTDRTVRLWSLELPREPGPVLEWLRTLTATRDRDFREHAPAGGQRGP
jgi:hypothetical protein